MSKEKLKRKVRDFYDEIGWQQVGDGIYQNALYEDLRPVSSEYIHKCHLRINRFLSHKGKYLLDAGSGPIQYPEYLTYSKGYQYRVCIDISIVALIEAREKIGHHGLFVVADIAYLPFRADCFNDLVSLHTIHHLPKKDTRRAYFELRRVLVGGGAAVIVNGWESSPLMQIFKKPISMMERILKKNGRPVGGEVKSNEEPIKKPDGTFVYKNTPQSLRELLGRDFPITIRVWRSVSVRFLRAMIHPVLMGRLWLKILYLKEEVFPSFFGEKGQYPLIIFTK
ncbi:MAG: class I SAM-dependent methyltransferase [Chloroflexi bacterium]|nr:class I SAM-dependent methyltransferase [Chloroflexota bacterium]